MRFFRNNRSLNKQPFSARETDSDYARIITDNLTYIEKQCCLAVRRSAGEGTSDTRVAVSSRQRSETLDNEADELLNEVLDRLKADDFKALREFKGRSKLTTYITTIISNLIIDLMRQKKGRSRVKERAREMGEVAERLYDLVFARGWSISEAHSHLEITLGIREPLEKLQEMLERMRGRGKHQMTACIDGEAAWLVPGTVTMAGDVVEVEVIDPRKNAEAALISCQKKSRMKQVITGLVAELNGEERFMLGMRFPEDDHETPKTNREIGLLLGLSEKTVDARIRRILSRFRETVLRQGLSLDDLIE